MVSGTSHQLVFWFVLMVTTSQNLSSQGQSLAIFFRAFLSHQHFFSREEKEINVDGKESQARIEIATRDWPCWAWNRISRSNDSCDDFLQPCFLLEEVEGVTRLFRENLFLRPSDPSGHKSLLATQLPFPFV